VSEGRSAASAEGGGWVDDVATCVAVSCCGCSRRGLVGGSEDLAGDVHGLHGVVLADAAGHEEAFDEAEDGGDARPEEEEIKDAESVAAEIEVMDAEAAKEKSEEDTNDFVSAGAFVFGVEPGALLVVHVDGVDGIGRVHCRSSPAVQGNIR
jgi:hypothetical protein